MGSAQSYRDELLRFAALAPGLLERHQVSASMAGELRDLLASLETARRFRVAVTGKIKQGKSTLINALIGRCLPTVGIDETTATINIFESGAQEDVGRIRVHWRDESRTPEDLVVSDFSRLQGSAGKSLADQIGYISIFSDVAFLNRVQLIDTPGEGGRQLNEINVKADALIRALPFVAEQADADRLARFGKQSRPFGSGAYNSIAVIQMWEEHWPRDPLQASGADWMESTPLDLAWSRAREQEATLGDAVSAVIPVSGLMELFSLDATAEVLEDLLEFAGQTPIEQLGRMLTAASIFRKREFPGLSIERRNALWERVQSCLPLQPACTWPILKMTAWAVRRHACTNAQELRTRLHELSNIAQLRTLLEERFFALSDLIQTGVQLESALAPCDSARQVLMVESDVCRDLVTDQAQIARTARDGCLPGSKLPADIAQVVARSSARHAAEIAYMEGTCATVEAETVKLRASYSMIQREIACLHELDSATSVSAGIDLGLKSDVRRLFGQFGIETFERLGEVPGASRESLVAKAWASHAFWRSSRHGFSSAVRTCAITRLEAILESLQEE